MPVKPKLKRSEDGSYLVYLADDRIGFVVRDGAKWKAVNSFMNWMARYKTRERALAGLVKRSAVDSAAMQ